MTLRTLVCPSCGAPLSPDAKLLVVTCPFCGATVTDDGPILHAKDYLRALARLDTELAIPDPEKATLGGLPYRVLGHLASGESSEVFLAERARRVTERVVLKVLRAPADRDLLEREHRILLALQDSSAQGAAHFTERLPQPVAHGTLRFRDAERPATALRYASGFVHTLEDVRSAYPDGVDPRHAVWLWRRMLEVLGFVHRAGFAHGALVPRHLLVHARDHGVMLVGWSAATILRAREKLPAVVTNAQAFYPEDLRGDSIPTTATDLAMTARCIAYVLGGDPITGTVPSSVPQGLAALVRSHADPFAPGPRTDDAWALEQEVSRVAREAFGPPKYVHLAMPGWSS